MEHRDANPEWQDVFASSMRLLINALLQNQTEHANRVFRFNIRYALTIYMEDENPDVKISEIEQKLKEMELSKKNEEELSVIMTYYQAKAGLKPVQVNRMTDSFFQTWSKRFSKKRKKK